MMAAPLLALLPRAYWYRVCRPLTAARRPPPKPNVTSSRVWDGDWATNDHFHPRTVTMANPTHYGSASRSGRCPSRHRETPTPGERGDPAPWHTQAHPPEVHLPDEAALVYDKSRRPAARAAARCCPCIHARPSDEEARSLPNPDLAPLETPRGYFYPRLNVASAGESSFPRGDTPRSPSDLTRPRLPRANPFSSNTQRQTGFTKDEDLRRPSTPTVEATGAVNKASTVRPRDATEGSGSISYPISFASLRQPRVMALADMRRQGLRTFQGDYIPLAASPHHDPHYR